MPGRQRFAVYTILALVAAVAVYLVGNASVPLWDRDEPRYAQASRQMAQSGDWVVPRYLGELRTKKPPLIYWCQAASMKGLGETPFAARLPSVVATTLVLALLVAGLWRSAGPRRAFWTVVVLGTSLVVVFAAKICLTDAVLLLWITIGQLCLFAAYRGRASWPVVLAFWLAAGLGALTKGTNLAVHAATMIALAALDVGRNWRSGRAWVDAVRWWGRLRPLVGVLVFAAVVAPWVLLVRRREPAFLPAMFGNVGKHVGSSAEGHAAPPGYYLLTVWAFFLPWSIFLPMAVILGWKRRRQSHKVRFALAALIGPWLFVEVMISKLPHYLLPAYPPLAFLVADVIVRSLRAARAAHLPTAGRPSDDHLRQPGFARGVGVWAFAMALVGAAPMLAAKALPGTPLPAAVLAAAVGLIYAGVVFVLIRRRRPAAGVATMAGGMLALCAVLFGLYFPRAAFLQTSVHVAATLKSHGVAGPASDPCPVVMLDYKEPSLAFYQGGSIRENSNLVLTNKLLDAVPEWLVVTRDVWEKPKTDPAARDRLEVVYTVKGIDVADGVRPVEVMVVRKRRPAAVEAEKR